MVAALDLWSIFVVQVFGNFWYAVIGLAALFFIIMIMGRVSMYSVLFFTLIFAMCMSMGYGYGFITIAFTLFILVRFVYDIILFVRGRI